MRLLDHFESFLGPMDHGWKDPPGEIWPFYVVRFSKGPISGVSIFSTLGLSDIALACPGSKKTIRHELIFMAPTSFGDRSIPALLHDIGKEAITRQHPYLCGEIIGPRGKLFDGTNLEALFLYNPVYLPDAFGSLRTHDGVRGIAWLIPITAQEAALAYRQGWEAFANLLVENDPDLSDMFRQSMVD